MKKFFKKISLVLAFALVLGSADHATVAKAADTWKFQSAAETLYLGSQTVGADTFDFNFSEAPAGYTTSNTFNWSSSNPKVASVEPNGGGVVTAVADGKTTITCRVTNKTTGLLTATASATVTVRTITHATKVEIYNAADASKTPITSAKLVVGETIDLNRQLTNAAGVVSAAGQATNTASTDKTAFKTSDEKVATVDASTGVVTAVKAGTATITAYTYDVKDANKTPIKTATCTITVAADASYTVKQTGIEDFTLSFVNDVKFDKNKLTVYKLFDGQEFVQYVRTTEVSKKNSKDVVVTLYFEFDEEETEYKVVYDGLVQTFTASIGLPASIVLTSKLEDETALYINNDDIGETAETTVKVKLLDENGIDITKLYNDTDDYDFNSILEDEGVDIDTLEDDFTFTVSLDEEEITAGQPIQIDATFEYELNDETVTVANSFVFFASDAAPRRILGITGAYFDSDSSSKGSTKSDADWIKDVANLTVHLDQEKEAASGSLYLHVRVKDNYGNVIYSNSEDKVSNDLGTVTFASADPNRLFVDEATGEIATIALGNNIPVVLYWTPDIEDAKTKAVAVLPVRIDAKRVVNKITIEIDGTSGATNAIAASHTAADGEKTTLKVSVYDNYNKLMSLSEAELENLIVLSTTKGSLKNTAKTAYALRADANVGGVYYVDVNGEDDFSFTAEGVKDSAKVIKAEFTVTYNKISAKSSTVYVYKNTTATTIKAFVDDVNVSVNKASEKSLYDDVRANTTSATVKLYNVTSDGVKVSEIDSSKVYFYSSEADVLAKIDSVSGPSAVTPALLDYYFWKISYGKNTISQMSHTTGIKAVSGTCNTFTLVDNGTPAVVEGIEDESVMVRKVANAGDYSVAVYRAEVKYDTSKRKYYVNAKTDKDWGTTFKVINETGSITMEETGSDLETDDPYDAVQTLFKFTYTDKIGKDTITELDNTYYNVVAKTVGGYMYIESIDVYYVPYSSASDVVDAVKATFTVGKTYPIVDASK